MWLKTILFTLLLTLGLLPLTSAVAMADVSDDGRAESLTDTRQTLSPVLSVSSPQHRVALLELYTSEGCSSCPPADRFLSELKKSGAHGNELIPLAFHVTYWDYIGWRDRFASPVFDQRQKMIARHNAQGTLYTPQFVLSGKDFRRYRHFSTKVKQLAAQVSEVDLSLSVTDNNNSQLELLLEVDSSRTHGKDIEFFIVITENDLVSDVNDGENEGERLHHDFVVRSLHGPFRQKSSSSQSSHVVEIRLDKQWDAANLAVVAFAQNPLNGEILQAVKLPSLVLSNQRFPKAR